MISSACKLVATALLVLCAACGEEPSASSEPVGPSASATTVTLKPEANIQDSVAKYATGTIFTLKPGVYRLQSVTPKNGQSFIGEAGAVLSGARLLTGFTRQGTYWVAGNQTQQGTRLGELRNTGRKNCMPQAPRCFYPEELWINNVRLRHVASLGAVVSGAWYFDYDANKIYLAQDPAGKTVETSVTPQAFRGAASNVTIRGLVIEKYATPFTLGTIHANGPGWMIVSNQVRYNHAIGIDTEAQATIRSNTVTRNLQLGMGGTGSNILIENNEVSFTNNPQMIEYGWAAGGTKYHGTQNLTARGNFIHHNNGPGLWTDIDNIYVLFENNRVEDNSRVGIYHEVSYDAIIRNNTSARNGSGFTAGELGLRGAGIGIRASQNVEVYGNTLTNNRGGIDLNQNVVRSGKYGPNELRNVYVHDNTVRMPKGLSGLQVTSSTGSAIFTNNNNRFRNNTYYLGSQSKPFYWWKASVSRQDSLTVTEWKNAGQDQTGTFIQP